MDIGVYRDIEGALEKIGTWGNIDAATGVPVLSCDSSYLLPGIAVSLWIVRCGGGVVSAFRRCPVEWHREVCARELVGLDAG